jgi:hypothetical protein
MSSPTPTPAPGLRAEEVRFEPDEPGLILLRRDGAVPVMRVSASPHFLWFEHGLAPLYAPVCPGPCTMRMQPGDYQLALAKDGGGPVPALDPVFIRGPSTIHGHYVDRSGARAGGIALALGGTAAGIVMIAMAASSEDICDASGYCYRRTTFNAPLTVGGVGVLLGSLIAGSILVSQHDEAHIFVTPLLAWTRPEQRTPTAASIVPIIEGAALTTRF